MDDPRQARTSPKLSCTNCRQRKIKCNKREPCLHCRTSQHTCVYPRRIRNRLPRQVGKHREEELFARIKHLESIVGQMASSTAPTNDYGTDYNTEETYYRPPQSPASVSAESGSSIQDRWLDKEGLAFVKRQETGSQYIGHTFWTMLGVEVGGLRKLLEDTADEEDEHDHITSNSFRTPYYSGVLFDFPLTFIEPERPSRQHRSILASFYFSNVHPLCMILHRPTINAYLENAIPSEDPADNIWKSKGLQAVAHAIYFAAVTSMSAGDCMKFLGAEKNDLTMHYKKRTEAALYRAEFLSSIEITTLQALTLYIMAIRSHNSDRTSWTLIATAVRIAHALGLHRDGDGRAFTFFVAEMRRRLWWQILVLDMRASENRGSELMILDGSFNSIMPHNLNDADFNLERRTIPLPSSGITEMTFCLISMDVSNTILKISFIPPFKERQALTLAQKEALVKECTDRIETVYLQGFDISDPYAWVIRTIAELLILKLWLVVQYPVECVHVTSQHFARGQSLRTATAFLNICELLEHSEPAAKFVWFFETYIPWHALAVALVELCKETVGPLADKAWAIIDKGYEKWEKRIANSRDGILWRPIKSLMKKAQVAREQGQTFAEPQSAPSRSSEPTSSAGRHDIPQPGLTVEPSQSDSLDRLYFGKYGSTTVTTYPSFGLGTLNSSEDFQSTEDQVNTSNWDHWNEFLFGVGVPHG